MVKPLPSPLVSAEVAAKLLGIGKSLLNELALRGELPSIELTRGARRCRRFDPRDIESFIAERRTGAKA